MKLQLATLDLATHVGIELAKAPLGSKRIETLNRIYLHMLPLQARKCEAAFFAARSEVQP